MLVQSHLSPTSSPTSVVETQSAQSLAPIEELEALTSADNHLHYVQSILDRSDFVTLPRSELQKKIERIQRRLNDPQLYLAVVGEFSSGKTTLINALLRDELLPTSALVATAAATRLQGGSNLHVIADWKGEQLDLTEGEICHLQNVDPKSSDPLVADCRQLINALTSQEVIAKDVEAITITHPASFLDRGITIIDTPGTNAVNQRHGEITRQIVEDEADAAIVIIPATVPLSQSLCDFLEESLRPYWHRCLFIVTRLDQVRLSEQETLMTDVKSRLCEHLGIQSPVVYGCAAQVVLDCLSGEAVQPDSQGWQRRLETLETHLLDRLRQERTLSIAERLLRLLNRLFEQLEEHLRSQHLDHKTQQINLKQNIIPDLSTFATQQKTICRQQVQEATTSLLPQVRRAVKLSHQQACDRIQQAIFNASDNSELKAVINLTAGNILRDHQEQLSQEIQQFVSELSQDSLSAGQKLDQAFTEAYRRLQALNRQIEIPTSLPDDVFQLNAQSVLAQSQTLAEKIENKMANWALGGAAAGAVIGSMILPGVGTVVGGMLGAFVSSSLGSALEDHKQQLWNDLQLGLNEHFETVQSQLCQAAQTYSQQVNTVLNRRVDRYVSTYQKAVQTLLQEQQQKLQTLEQLDHRIQAEFKEIDHRRNTLGEQQRRLATLTQQSSQN